MAIRITGKYLNGLWSIGAKHALYNHDGGWYHQLTRFPGALCDSEGYILFVTKSEFRNCPYLRIKQDAGCKNGIRSIPGYVRRDSLVANDINQPSNPERAEQRISRIIRDTAISSELKLLYSHTCQLCGTLLKLGKRRYCEAHHVKPLGKPHDGSDTKDNIICVCPNCHVLLDYAAIPLSPGSLKLLKHKLKPENVVYHNALHDKARLQIII